MAKKSKPTRAIEPHNEHFSNPLLRGPKIHSRLAPLFEAMILALVLSNALADSYRKLLELKESAGLPKSGEWPGAELIEQEREQHAKLVDALRKEHKKRREKVIICDFCEPEWTRLMREWSREYVEWCHAIANACEAAKSADVASIMDGGEARPAHRWTTRASIALNNLAGKLHPIGIGGNDGMGFFRGGLPLLSTDFQTARDTVCKRIDELRAIPGSTVAIPEVSSKPAVVPMRRPVLVADAAKIVPMRPDSLLRMLQKRGVPITGLRGFYQAELEHIIYALPKRSKRLRIWAEEKYPQQ